MCDMETDGGGWTRVLQTDTVGQHSGSTAYRDTGNYNLAQVPGHGEIAAFIEWSGALQAGIASAKLNSYVPGQTGVALIDFSAATWELWTSDWATFTGKSASSCFHSSWQDTCVASSSSVGTCSGSSSWSYGTSNTSWVSHSGCSSGSKSGVTLALAVR